MDAFWMEKGYNNPKRQILVWVGKKAAVHVFERPEISIL
jgi:hypothetical protein